MGNLIINGKLISDMILDNVKYEYSKHKENKNCKLVVVTIGDDLASKVYVNNKKKACEYVGFDFCNKRFSSDTAFDEISNYMKELDFDTNVHGVIVQLPIISNVLNDYQKSIISQLITPEKDVDGFGRNSLYAPCTPKGIIRMLDIIDYKYEGKTALVIGRSDIVGKPIAKLLLDKDCTVIQAHSKTPKETLCRMFTQADLVVSAVGKCDVLNEQDADQYFKDNSDEWYSGFYVKSGVRAIIDVGINRDADGKLCGDFSEEFKQKYSKYYTPVPKGVGPMTVAMLIENVWQSFIR